MASFPTVIPCPFCKRVGGVGEPAVQTTKYVDHGRTAYYKCETCGTGFSIRLDKAQETKVME